MYCELVKALLTDLYQFTMMQGLFKEGLHRTPCVFDRFYRKTLLMVRIR